MQIFLDNDEGKYGYDERFFNSIIETIGEFVVFAPDAEISIVLTDDSTIQGINKEHRNIDKPTDVLSFPMDEPLILGDVVISIDTMKRQANDAGITERREIAFLFIHGFLHLIGFDHELGIDEEQEMFQLQEDILRQWEATNG